MTNLSVPGLDLAAYMRDVGERARAAARLLARAPTGAKDKALEAAAAAIVRDAKRLLAANATDVAASRAGGDDAAFIDRLSLDAARIAAMAEGLR
ncbi:MAG: glutamate-5-semialdehyde dehydrogenase, partial [Casimicrobiaceae bacterium]